MNQCAYLLVHYNIKNFWYTTVESEPIPLPQCRTVPVERHHLKECTMAPLDTRGAGAVNSPMSFRASAHTGMGIPHKEVKFYNFASEIFGKSHRSLRLPRFWLVFYSPWGNRSSFGEDENNASCDHLGTEYGSVEDLPLWRQDFFSLASLASNEWLYDCLWQS